jgi:hypothetical protein
MNRSRHLAIVSSLLLLLLAGCGMTVAGQHLLLPQDLVDNKYDAVRTIVVEEAANNGFGTVASEVKPSKYTDYKGSIYFKLQTAAGTDQLTVELTPKEGKVSVYVHGAGTKGNADGAIKAITARLEQLGGTVVR